MANQLPAATTYLIKDTGKIKIHTLVSPPDMFANATHIIELPTQLILVDGHYFAQYALEFRALADSLHKPITRFYISHDHPDHYIGMGDAFADVTVYALAETKESIEQNGQHELEDKQKKFGNLIASRLNIPSQIVQPGEEVIDGVRFVFEKVENAESAVALVIKLPEVGVLIIQDVLYHNTHLFLTGPSREWKAVMQHYHDAKGYDTILAGHGIPTDKNAFNSAITYIDKANAIFSTAKTAADFKQQLLAAYPNYAGAGLIDIYLPFLFQKV
jgi:glyoxylase-like metal-dependent hydrolase (beta-lactamase superfamily II)